MIKEKIKLAVFDMAGTTLQDCNEVETCFLDAISETDLNVSKSEINAMMGWSKYKVFETLWKNELGSKHLNFRSLVNESYRVFTDRLEKHYLSNPVKPIEGIETVFDFCRKNEIRIALTTGFYRKVTDIILERLGWDLGLDANYISIDKKLSTIDCSVSSSEVTEGRPSPDMILLAMKHMNVTNSKQVINIGDTPSDLLSARKADVSLSIGVTYGTHTKEQLQKEDFDFLAGSPNEIIQIIEKQIKEGYPLL